MREHDVIKEKEDRDEDLFVLKSVVKEIFALRRFTVCYEEEYSRRI